MSVVEGAVTDAYDMSDVEGRMKLVGTVVGDFERQSALMLGCNALIGQDPEMLVEMIGLLVDRIPLVVTVAEEEQRKHFITMLCDWGVPAHRVTFVAMPGRGTWVRDYGPQFMRPAEG